MENREQRSDGQTHRRSAMIDSVEFKEWIKEDLFSETNITFDLRSIGRKTPLPMTFDRWKLCLLPESRKVTRERTSLHRRRWYRMSHGYYTTSLESTYIHSSAGVRCRTMAIKIQGWRPSWYWPPTSVVTRYEKLYVFPTLSSLNPFWLDGFD